MTPCLYIVYSDWQTSESQMLLCPALHFHFIFIPFFFCSLLLYSLRTVLFSICSVSFVCLINVCRVRMRLSITCIHMDVCTSMAYFFLFCFFFLRIFMCLCVSSICRRFAIINKRILSLDVPQMYVFSMHDGL